MSENARADDEKKLTGKQIQAALFLAKGSTITDVAKEIDVNEKTIRRWKILPDFTRAVRQAEDDLYTEALARLKRETSNAIDCLVRNLDPEAAAPYVQVQAASKIIDAGLQVAKVQELEKLLEDLQARLEDG